MGNEEMKVDFYNEDSAIYESNGFYKLFKKVVRLKELNGNEKIILAIIFSYTENNMDFYMSNSKLAIETGIDNSTVSRLISSLRNAGWIKTYKVKEPKNKNIIGRLIIPQKEFIKKELNQFYSSYEYVEYGDNFENIND